MKHCYNAKGMQCIIIYHQIQQFHKNLKNTKSFQKPQNLGLKCVNAWEMNVKEHIPKD